MKPPEEARKGSGSSKDFYRLFDTFSDTLMDVRIETTGIVTHVSWKAMLGVLDSEVNILRTRVARIFAWNDQREKHQAITLTFSGETPTTWCV